MERVCVSAIKSNGIVFYREDLSSKELKDFLFSKNLYLECVKTKQGNIFYDGTIILQEWNKYKVKSMLAEFVPKDFLKIGEYGSDDFGNLLFKNCVGYSKFKGVDLIIESSKITQSEMEQLVNVVNSYIVNLSYDFNQVSFSAVTRTGKKKTDLDYHVYLLVHNALKTQDRAANIFTNFNMIENNPCRTMTSEIKYENIGVVREISDLSLMDAFCSTSELVLCKNTKNKMAKRFFNGTKNFLPKEILYEEIIDTFDNQENRFIKYFLSWCVNIIERFQKQFTQQEDFRNYELIEENDRNIKKLNTILNQSFLANVGEMQSIPMYSTILTRRAGYRQLFYLYLGIRSMPYVESNSEDIQEMIENKSLDILYENYCYFGLVDVISDIYGEKLNKKKYKVYKSSFSKTLEKKTTSNFFEFTGTESLPKVCVHYNKNYIVESYSKAFNPDISLEIFDTKNNLFAIYIFDSKFKAVISNMQEEDDNKNIKKTERKKYKYDDISKMHTYRDAIKVARGAFIFYPGTENEIFYEDPSIDKTLLYGVGAFKLGPGSNSDFLYIKVYIEKLLKAYKELGC